MKIIKHKLNPNTDKDGERLRFALVYQAGIANIFQVDCFNLNSFGRNERRIFQGDFRGAECIAHGLGLAGAVVQSLACNKAGDIDKQDWTTDLEAQPFSEKFSPVFFVIGL